MLYLFRIIGIFYWSMTSISNISDDQSYDKIITLFTPGTISMKNPKLLKLLSFKLVSSLWITRNDQLRQPMPSFNNCITLLS